MKSESTNRLAILFPLRRLLQIGMVGAWAGLVLVSHEVQVHDRHVGPFIGSDHFPTVIDIGF